MTDATPHASRLLLDADAVNAFLLTAFPQADPETRATVIEAAPGRLRVQARAGGAQMRPGGLVSGPTQMGLMDMAAYALVLCHVGPVAMAVTTSLTCHFLRGCPPPLVLADAVLLRLGRRIVTVDVRLWTRSPDYLVAQGTVSYALPTIEASHI